jgi:hypothetical protein
MRSGYGLGLFFPCLGLLYSFIFALFVGDNRKKCLQNNPEVVGSSPASATKQSKKAFPMHQEGLFLYAVETLCKQSITFFVGVFSNGLQTY